MENKSNFNELQKIFKKRNFYTLKDSGNIFLYALLLPLAVGFVFSFIITFIAKKLGIEAGAGENLSNILIEGNYLWYIIPTLLLTQIVFVCLYFSYHKIARISLKATNLSFKKANIWSVLFSAFVGILCIIGFVWLIEGCFGNLFDRLGIGSSPEFPIENVGMLFVYLFLLGVLPAICEELIFRGVIFQGLKSKFSTITSVLVCATLFAIMHQNIEQLIYPFLLGIVLGFVMEKTGNLLYCIIIHMFNNFTTIILSYLMATGAIKISFNTSWWGCLCAILLAVATVGILFLIYHFYLRKHKKIENEKDGELNQTPPLMAGKLPVSMVVGIVIALFFLVINALL